MPYLVEAEALGKRYGRRHWAARDVSFALEAGQILGLAGPNGAGKTTIVRMLAALIRPTAGTARVLGGDVVSAAARVRENIGLLPENVRLYDRLTADEHLTFCARVRGIPAAEAAGRITELLDLFHLTSRRADLLRTFSKGMIRRVALATAFLHRPRLLLLDEPTDGLDPVGARLVAEVLTRMKQTDGPGMILCSHDLGLIAEVADQVAFVRAGRLAACGSPADMASGNGHRVRLRLLDPAQELLAFFRAVDPRATVSNGTAELTVGRIEADVPPLVSRLVEAGARVVSVAEVPLSLEDHYLKVMQDHEA